MSHKRLVSTRRGGESERIPEYKNQSVARTVASVNHCGLREPRARIKLQGDVFLGVDLVHVAGGLLGLGSGFLGVLVVGLDILGHVFCLFS